LKPTPAYKGTCSSTTPMAAAAAACQALGLWQWHDSCHTHHVRQQWYVQLLR
jgi:hypothetical protein